MWSCYICLALPVLVGLIYNVADLKVRAKGHVKPANYLDAHEKFLIGVATKGGMH